MVTRKPSIPYPTSPPPPPPDHFGPSLSRHDIDASNVPPIPQTITRAKQDSPYQDVGNPWQEQPPASAFATASGGFHEPQSDRAGTLRTPTVGRQQNPEVADGTRVPDVLKAGWSGQNTPRSSLDSDRSRDFWDSSDDEDGKKGDKPGKNLQTHFETGGVSKRDEIPPSLQVRRKPVSPRIEQRQSPPEFHHDFASNNPFRQQPLESTLDKTDDHLKSYDAKGKGREADAMVLPPITQFADLDLGISDPSRADRHSNQAELEQSPWEDVPKAQTFPHQTHSVPMPAQAPPTIPAILPPSPYSRQAPLIAVDSEDDARNPWTPQNKPPSPQPSPLPEQRAVYTNDLLDRGPKSGDQGGSFSLGDELKALPNHAPGATSQTSLSLQDDGPTSVHLSAQPAGANHEGSFVPPPGPPPFHAKPIVQTDVLAPVQPPRPAAVTTSADIEELNKQRNETYQIKHFNWFDHRTRKLRSSSMLIQNKNGPCPLLALVNALILGARDQDQAVLDEFLRTREQVTLGTIIENLVMELLSATTDGELPDVDELNRFLLKLRTGMNMNPRFVTPPPPPPNLMDARNSVLHIPQGSQARQASGTFETSQDVRLYSAFGIETVHGWLAEPGSDALAAFERSAQNYEDAQAKLFGEDELEFKLTRNGLTPEEQMVWEDIVSMKHFFQSHPTQLTTYGLDCIKSSLLPGSFTVLFRNDHFSTIYKSPQDGKLYSLITDAGYADRAEIVWESLVDISGQGSEIFSGDFKSVSHTGQHTSDAARRLSGQPSEVNNSQDSELPQTPSLKQEQEDADFAMAMMLQEEEEQRDRERRSRAASTSNPSSNRPSGARRSTGNVASSARPSTGNNASSSVPELRPVVPPRGSRAAVPAVNRSADARDPDAPPAYEEAARGKAYHPPLGSPLHPTYSATPGGDNAPFASTSNVNLNAQNGGSSSNTNPNARLHQRRSSAYGDNADRLNTRASTTAAGFGQGPSPAYDFNDGNMPGSYVHTGRGGHGQSINYGVNSPYSAAAASAGQRPRDRDRDCVVM